MKDKEYHKSSPSRDFQSYMAGWECGASLGSPDADQAQSDLFMLGHRKGREAWEAAIKDYILDLP